MTEIRFVNAEVLTVEPYADSCSEHWWATLMEIRSYRSRGAAS